MEGDPCHGCDARSCRHRYSGYICCPRPLSTPLLFIRDRRGILVGADPDMYPALWIPKSKMTRVRKAYVSPGLVRRKDDVFNFAVVNPQVEFRSDAISRSSIQLFGYAQ